MTASTTAAAPSATSTPSVLAVVVVGAGRADGLRECLLSLAHQTYPKLGVLAVDDASDESSREMLLRALGPRRVIHHDRGRGLARAVASVLERPIASGADFVLLVDPAASLDPDAVARLVEAAIGIGVEEVGIVGAKIVDRDRPRHLRDIGRSSDRFGHPYSPLQPGEIDQGQFDRVLEVLCVSSSSMLIAREAWQRIGTFDERLDPDHADLDLCWRARVAGYRVLMTPLARVRIGAPDGLDGPATTPTDHRGARFQEDRAAIAAMFKNYGWISLLWVVPLALLLGVVRFLYLTLGRRFDEAVELAEAWGWNLAHLPGTWSRRRRAQKARRVPDRSLHRFMESAGLRLPRWFATAERILEEQRAIDEADEGEPIRRRLRDRTASLIGTHPVIVTSFLAILVGAGAVRELIGVDVLMGGALPAVPDRAADLFAELAAAARSTPLGGSLPASPALGALGLLSTVALGDPQLAQKALLIAGIPLTAILAYRACVRLSARPGPAVLAAVAYALSAITLWTFSEGRVGLLIALAVLPAGAERVEAAFARAEPMGSRPRFVAGVAVTIAIGVAFYPGILLGIGVLVAILALAGASRGRGLLLVGIAGVGAAVLLFPFLPTLIADGGRSLSSLIGTNDPIRVGRLALGPGPGTWTVAAFLPLSAAIGAGLVRGQLRGPAARAMLGAAVGLLLAWSSTAGYLPDALTNAPAYAALAAFSMAALVAFGLTSFTGSLRSEAFGLRQVSGALLGAVLVVGIVLQAIASMVGAWAIGGSDRIPAAWAVVDGAAAGSFRVLWVAGPGGAGLPPPAGDPRRRLDAGDATVRFTITDREGSSIYDLGRPLSGPGPDRLDAALAEILGGSTRHGGALLSSFGIRFVVGEEGALPPAADAALGSQLDLDLVPATGLTIYRNAAAIPPAAVLDASTSDRAVITSSDPIRIATWRPVPSTPLERVGDGWVGPATDGTVFLSTEHDDAWALEGSDRAPETAFGWATSFRAESGEPIRVRHERRLPAVIQLVVLGVVWMAALWITRRPVPR